MTAVPGQLDVVRLYKNGSDKEDRTLLARLANGVIVHVVTSEEVDQGKPTTLLGPTGWKSALSQAKALGASGF